MNSISVHRKFIALLWHELTMELASPVLRFSEYRGFSFGQEVTLQRFSMWSELWISKDINHDATLPLWRTITVCPKLRGLKMLLYPKRSLSLRHPTPYFWALQSKTCFYAGSVWNLWSTCCDGILRMPRLLFLFCVLSGNNKVLTARALLKFRVCNG